MIAFAARYFGSIAPVFIDGLLYVIIAVAGFASTMLGSDEAFEMFSKPILFYIKLTNGSLLAGATALKMFRSTAYSDHRESSVEVANVKTVAAEARAEVAETRAEVAESKT